MNISKSSYHDLPYVAHRYTEMGDARKKSFSFI